MPRLVGITALVILIAVVVAPFLFTANAALKTSKQWVQNPVGLAFPPSVANFESVWNRLGMPAPFINSLLVTIVSVILLWAVSLPAAFAVSKLRFPGRIAVLFVVFGSIMIPIQSILDPLFILAFHLGFVNQFYGLIFTLSAFGVAETVFLLAAFMKAIPNELIEAAQIDGASTFALLRHVIAPLAKPALATTGIINFVWIWNNLLLTVILIESPSRETLTVAVGLIPGEYGVGVPILAAAALIGAAPLVVVFLLGQRYVVRGVMQGAFR